MRNVILNILIFAMIFTLACNTQSKKMHHTKNLREDWKIKSSAKLESSGSSVSSKDYQTKDWFNTNVPTTVLNALVEAGEYKDPYFGKNLEEIDSSRFTNSWWFRKEFEVSPKEVTGINTLKFKGINYYANIWLNGKKIGTKDTVFGTYRFFQFNVDSLLKKGKNILAVEVFQPQPGDFTVGFVDWNPTPPDKNIGLIRDVALETTADVSLSSPYVTSDIDLETLDKAKLKLNLILENKSREPVEGQLKFQFANKQIEKKVKISAQNKKMVELTSKEHPELVLQNPKLWWPHTIGEPNLYEASVTFENSNIVSDKEKFDFGIREIDDYVNKQGHRGYKVNGRKIMIKGAGWTDNMMLEDTHEKNEARIKYAKHLNLNTIRLEGFWGKDEQLYELCDKHGILLMAGWSCQWEWEDYLGSEVDEYGGVKSKEDIKLVSEYWEDQILWLREHPSIFVWLGGSDMLPRPELERNYLAILDRIDQDRPYLGAAGGKKSKVTGKTDVKMKGPYDVVPPNYWFEDTAYGGAYGFNTETGPGAQVPPLKSIKKMIPEEKLWPLNDVWKYHCGRNEFNNLDNYNEMMFQRYWKPEGVEEYTQLAQVMNYELMRPMFEAFQVNKHKSTGVIQWMYNSAWPEVYWQLFDYYLRPNGAFYGAKKGCKPFHILYNYKDNGVWIVNSKSEKFKDVKARVRVYNSQSKCTYKRTKEVTVSQQSELNIFNDLPALNNEINFVDLRMFKNGKEIDNNFYWIPPKLDELDYENSSWYTTPVKDYANLSDLKNLPKTKIDKDIKQLSENKLKLNIKNSGDKIAFFVRLELIDGKDNSSVLPVFWGDNYISLLPGESRSLSVKYKEQKVIDPIVNVSGINVK